MDFVANYHLLKEAVVAASFQSHALIHVHVGLAIYVLAQIIWGTRRGSVPAVMIVAFFAIFNELLDRSFWGGWRPADTAMDLFLTLFWPIILMIVSKLRRMQWNMRIARQRDAASLLRTTTMRRSSAGSPVPGE